MRLAGGDPAEIKLTAQGTVVTSELIETVRDEMGLNDPFIKQYMDWLMDVLHGDLGVSYTTGIEVTAELKQHLPYTLMLTISSMLLTLIVSIPLGILAAVKRNKWEDHLIRGCSFMGNAIPGFFLALILLLIFSLKLKLLPILSESGIKSIILPTLTLSIAMSSKYIRQIRAVVIEELEKDYVKGLRARGVSEKVILYKNVLKNIMMTLMTITGLSIGSLIGGTAIVESIFVWPGIGKLVLTAISNRDYPVIQGYVLWMGCIFVVINLIVDLLYRVFDPRVRAQ
ncbi:MAG: ABC transporter permease [Candidatus Cellulosilyticum pullistercoris]|uniref:Nickel import system permease protein NikB n=1 Tax=Candidatus Cellulosilyticum pullistercoris TaxID=2838521 RepID=A0A9E2NKB8_9FIRM|nr:ABC transporter permease [Candidatus Cellulosilyticum pullistercoris]